MPRKRPRIYKIDKGAPGYYESGSLKSTEHFMNSSHANSKRMTDNNRKGELTISSVFESALQAALKKSPFEEDELMIYRHGVIVRPKQGMPAKYVEKELQKIISEIPNSSAHLVNEDGTFSIRVNLGSVNKGTDSEGAVSNIEEYSDIFERIREYITNEYGETDWFTFFDTEDALYE